MTTIPFEIDSAKRRLIEETERQNGLRLAPNQFTNHMLQDQDPARYVSYIIGPFIPNTGNPAADECRIWASLTAWYDGHEFVQFILQDCELDFVNLTSDTTVNMNLHPLSYTRR